MGPGCTCRQWNACATPTAATSRLPSLPPFLSSCQHSRLSPGRRRLQALRLLRPFAVGSGHQSEGLPFTPTILLPNPRRQSNSPLSLPWAISFLSPASWKSLVRPLSLSGGGIISSWRCLIYPKPRCRRPGFEKVSPFVVPPPHPRRHHLVQENGEAMMDVDAPVFFCCPDAPSFWPCHRTRQEDHTASTPGSLFSDVAACPSRVPCVGYVASISSRPHFPPPFRKGGPVDRDKGGCQACGHGRIVSPLRHAEPGRLVASSSRLAGDTDKLARPHGA